MAGKRTSSRIQSRDDGSRKAPDLGPKGPEGPDEGAARAAGDAEVPRSTPRDGENELPEPITGGRPNQDENPWRWPRRESSPGGADMQLQNAVMSGLRSQGEQLKEMSDALKLLVGVLNEQNGQRNTRAASRERVRLESPPPAGRNGKVIDGHYVPTRRSPDRGTRPEGSAQRGRSRSSPTAGETSRMKTYDMPSPHPPPGDACPAYADCQGGFYDLPTREANTRNYDLPRPGNLRPGRSPPRNGSPGRWQGAADAPPVETSDGPETARRRPRPSRPGQSDADSDDYHMFDHNMPPVDPFSNVPGVPRTVAQAAAIARSGQAAFAPAAMPQWWRQHKLAYYDGSTPLQDYLKIFERVAEVSAWTDVQKCDALVTHLTDSAQQVYTDAPDHVGRDYHLMVKELRSVFEPTGQAQLGQAIKRLVRQAHPEADRQTQDRLAREAFIDAIDERELRSRVRDKEPETLGKAVQVAVRSEAYYEVDKAKGDRGKPKRSIRHVGFTDPGVSEDETDEEYSYGVHLTSAHPRRPDSLDRQRSKKAADKGDAGKKCRLCSRMGHTMENCPEIKCLNCEENGHMARGCPHGPRHIGKNGMPSYYPPRSRSNSPNANRRGENPRYRSRSPSPAGNRDAPKKEGVERAKEKDKKPVAKGGTSGGQKPPPSKPINYITVSYPVNRLASN